jgi:hypothetical protein
MSSVVKKILAATISVLIGLVLIPILSLEFSFEWLPLLFIYFFPGFCIALIILFELMTRIRFFRTVYRFVQGISMILLFIALLIVEWVIIWIAHPNNDIVFTSQFVTATILSILTYNQLGHWMAFLKKDKVH